MHHFRTMIATALAVGLASGPVFGQTLLKKLESKLKTVIENVAAAPDPNAVPGSGYLGASVDDTAVPGQGVVVQMVKPGTPAEASGLKAGDIITAIDDKPCRGLDDLDAVFGQATVGTRLRMTVTRGGKNEPLTVTLGKRPAAPPATGLEPPAIPPATPAPSLELPPLSPPATPAPPAATPPRLDLPLPPATPAPADSPLPAEPADSAAIPSGRASLGISVLPLSDELRAQYGIPLTVSRGAVIVGLRPGGPADTAGLPLGGVIRQIAGVQVNTADDLISVVSASKPGQEVELSYYQGERLTRKNVKLGAATAVGLGPAAPSIDLPPPPASPPAASGPDRPLLRRFEDLVDDKLANPPRTPIGSTILDPSAIKLLFERVSQLEERVKQLEGKVGVESAAPPASPAVPPPALPLP